MCALGYVSIHQGDDDEGNERSSGGLENKLYNAQKKPSRGSSRAPSRTPSGAQKKTSRTPSRTPSTSGSTGKDLYDKGRNGLDNEMYEVECSHPAMPARAGLDNEMYEVESSQPTMPANGMGMYGNTGLDNGDMAEGIAASFSFVFLVQHFTFLQPQQQTWASA